MKTLIAALLFVLLSGDRPARAREPYFADLSSGRYEIGIDGLLCHTCARLATDEVAGLSEVQKAAVDFDREVLVVTVRPGRTLAISRLRKALKRAAKRVDLGTKFTVRSVLYRV